MDPHAEAFNHAARPGWRAWSAYVDRVLDDYLDARSARDVADLEELYRAKEAPVVVPGKRGVPVEVARPFDHGAEWGAP